MQDSPSRNSCQKKLYHAPLSPSTGDLLIGSKHQPSAKSFPTWCPWARTLLGTDTESGAMYVIQIRCKRWGCRVCGERKAKSLAMRVAEAEPNRFVTLTVNPSAEISPKSAWEKNSRHIPTLIKTLRKSVGPIEYFRVLEVTRKGWPHWHFLVRSGYIAQKLVSDEWCKLTGAPIVDVRQVKKTFAAYSYCVKYLAKQAYVPWTNRRCTWSKDFFPPREPFEVTRIPMDQKEVLDRPPHFVLRWLFDGMPCDVVSSDAVRIPQAMQPRVQQQLLQVRTQPNLFAEDSLDDTF